MIYVEASSWDDICKIYDELHDNLNYHIPWAPLRIFNAVDTGHKVYILINKPLATYQLETPYSYDIYSTEYFLNKILPTWKCRRKIHQYPIYREYVKECLVTIIGGTNEPARRS